MARYYGCTFENPKESWIWLSEDPRERTPLQAGSGSAHFHQFGQHFEVEEGSCRLSMRTRSRDFTSWSKSKSTTVGISPIINPLYPNIHKNIPINRWYQPGNRYQPSKDWSLMSLALGIPVPESGPCRPKSPCRSCGISTSCRPRV